MPEPICQPQQKNRPGDAGRLRRVTRAVAVVLVLVLGRSGQAENTNAAAPAAKSRVVLVRDAGAATGAEADPAKVRAMVAKGITLLTAQPDEAAAWRTLVSSNDVVGIKIDTAAAPLQCTRRAVVEAIAAGLRSAGVAATNIIVWDRDPRKMQTAGFDVRAATAPPPSSPPPFQVRAILPDGWDAEEYYENSLVSRLIWGDLLFGKEGRELSTRSHLPRLLTRTLTKLINVPVLQDHDACGLAGCLYHASLDLVDNGRRFETYGQKGDPAIAEICALPPLRHRLVLNVMDALVAGYAGGPAFKLQYSWNFGGLYFGRDPVAVDAQCLELLETKRSNSNIPHIGDRASHLATAARLGLGQADLDSIELLEVTP